MAKRKYISDFERDVMRIGHAHGLKAPSIARFLRREKMTVYNHIKAMQDNGTINDLPLCFVADEIAEAIRKADAAHMADRS